MPYPVKAANVFLTDDGSADGSVKLGDFGISKASSTQTITSLYISLHPPLLSPSTVTPPYTPFLSSQALSTQTNLAVTVCGTPFYFSPELIQSEPYREPSDVWALGVLLFELLTLTRPFNGNNIAVLALNITKGAYAGMARVRPRLARSNPCGHRPPLYRSAPAFAQGCPLQGSREESAFRCIDFGRRLRRWRSAACPKLSIPPRIAYALPQVQRDGARGLALP